MKAYSNKYFFRQKNVLILILVTASFSCGRCLIESNAAFAIYIANITKCCSSSMIYLVTCIIILKLFAKVEQFYTISAMNALRASLIEGRGLHSDVLKSNASTESCGTFQE